MLLDGNAEVNAAAAKNYGSIALQGAVGNGHLQVVETLLAANADANAAAAERNGRTAIQAAAERGHLRILQRLLRACSPLGPGYENQQDQGSPVLRSTQDYQH